MHIIPEQTSNPGLLCSLQLRNLGWPEYDIVIKSSYILKGKPDKIIMLTPTPLVTISLAHTRGTQTYKLTRSTGRDSV